MQRWCSAVWDAGQIPSPANIISRKPPLCLLRTPTPGSPPLSSTSPLFVPLPLGCQIWLTQSVVSLLRLAPGPKPSALHHRSSPCTRREGEGGTEGPGTSGQLSTFFFVFLITLPACPRCWGLVGAAKWGLEAGQGIQSWGDPRARA